MQLFGKTLSEVIISSSFQAAAGESGITSAGLARTLIFIYFTGFIAFSGRLLFNIFLITDLVLNRGKKDGRIIRFSGLHTAGFSAMGKIFINSDLSDDEEREIVKHEQKHLDFNHFVDIVFIESVKTIQWFNPFIHLFDRSLRSVHEYQADEGCLTGGIPVLSYQRILMNQILHTKVFSITNSFSNPTLIKKRMIMMTKERSRRLANLKLLMILPVIAIVMIAFSSCSDKAKNAEITSSGPVALDANAKVLKGSQIPTDAPPPPPPPPLDSKGSDEPLTVVDEMPLFKGGDKAIIEFIRSNVIYPENAIKNGIQGRVFVKFTVKPDGSIGQASIIQGVNPELDAESLRVVAMLPAFEKPGIKDGKPVSVWYNLPITFALK
jgi:TonB family protein